MQCVRVCVYFLCFPQVEAFPPRKGCDTKSVGFPEFWIMRKVIYWWIRLQGSEHCSCGGKVCTRYKPNMHPGPWYCDTGFDCCVV